jgi:adhesin transport system outer membrane protein
MPGMSCRALAIALSLGAGVAARAQTGAPTSLPEPTNDPMRLDLASDPILRLARTHASPEEFRAAIAAAVVRHPGTSESRALTEEARAVEDEAKAQLLPSGDITLTSYQIISRAFSNDPNNIIERSRPEHRTDALVSVQQTAFDFGVGKGRVAAAGARLRAAAAEAEYGADRTALSAIGAWYDVFGYRALVALAEAFVANQQDLRAAVAERIRQGVSAPGDVAQVESYIASAQTRLARFRRQLANAEARFTELAGEPPPAELERAPVPEGPAMTKDAAALAAASAPAARAAQAMAESARQERKVARAERLPQIGVGVDAGRYGVFETERDYDVRARVILRQRLFGGIGARAAQASARARAAEARASRVRDEASRDAAIAWSDVKALEQQLVAMEASYIASRRSRDVLVERFLASRGTLFDVVAAEDAYFESAAAYIQALSELDAARYVLLSRTGGLLTALAIDPDDIGGAP